MTGRSDCAVNKLFGASTPKAVLQNFLVESLELRVVRRVLDLASWGMEPEFAICGALSTRF